MAETRHISQQPWPVEIVFDLTLSIHYSQATSLCKIMCNAHYTLYLVGTTALQICSPLSFPTYTIYFLSNMFRIVERFIVAHLE